MAALIGRQCSVRRNVVGSERRKFFSRYPTRACRSEHDEYANIPSADNSRGVSVEYHSPNRSEEV